MPATANAGGWKPQVLTAAGQLQAARLRVVTKAPYYRACVTRLVPREVPGLGTMGVTATGQLWWDAKAIERWLAEPDGANKMGGVMVHACLHLLLNHEARGIAVGAVSDDARATWNTATDYAINTMLAQGGWPLPAEGMFPERDGFPRDATAEQYYALLCAKKAQAAKQGGKPGQPGQPGKGGGGSPQQGAQGQQPGAAQGTARTTGGHCGGCTGHALPGEAPAGADPQPGDMTPVELDRVRRAVAADVQREASKSRGTMPAELVRWADEMLAPAKVSWQQQLQRAVRVGVSVMAGVQDYTRSRLSRRQWGIGVGPGKPMVAAMIARKPRVAFALDTSGSVGDAEIKQAASEVGGILRALGCPIEFLACDAAVGAAKRVARVADLRGAIVGGGGTDFRPVFAKLERDGFEGVLVYATDGHGPAPVQEPRGIKTVWLLVGKHTAEPAQWGSVIRVDA